MIDPSHAWAPYVATVDDPWDIAKVAHLHRRAAFGGGWNELQRDVQAGAPASIARFMDPPKETDEFRRISDGLLRAAGGENQSDAFSSPADARRAAAWWLYRMTYGPDPLGEKLTLFWHNHFATALRGVYSLPLMLQQNQTLREHARGRFGELLAAIESDPAMLVWLDGGRNTKEHPNENFARELLELFTLGIGNYTEADVRAAARALTGWTEGRNDLLQRTREFTREADLVDDSEKTFLGQTGPWETRDVLRIILEQPAVAEHLCRQLYRWFVDETRQPGDELIAPLAAELRASDYSIRHVVGVILRSRLFYSQTAYRRRVKSPVEYCVGVIRQLEPKRSPNLLLLAARSCERQGQKLFDPPSVNGWSGGRSWLNSNTMLVRARWSVEILQGNPAVGLPEYDPQAWGEKHDLRRDAMAAYCTLLADGELDNATANQIDYLNGQSGTAAVLSALQLVLQSPAYQLA